MTNEMNGGGLPPEQARPHPPDETPTDVPVRPFTNPKHSRQGSLEAGRKRNARAKLENPVTVTRFSQKPSATRMPAAEVADATPPEDPIKTQGKRHPSMKHRDTPQLAADRAAHAECKASCFAWTDSKRPPTHRELDILNAILAGQLALDTPPKFLKQILTPLEIALFSDQMRQQFGFLQVPIKALARLPTEMTSTSLGRLFFPMHASTNREAVQDCDALRRDMHSCYIHPHGRKLIIQFNSKQKASLWRDRQIAFLGHASWLRHYRRPEDATSHLDTEETQKCTAYSFRLLNIPAHIKALQVIHLLQQLEVVVTSMEIAQHMGSGELDANSYLVVTNSGKVPPQLVGKSRISIGTTTVQLHHFQDYGNMPCHGCAALDHQAEKCPKTAFQTERVITLSPTLWADPTNTEITTRPTFLEWRSQIDHHSPSHPISTPDDEPNDTHTVATRVPLQLTTPPTKPHPSTEVDAGSQSRALNHGTQTSQPAANPTNGIPPPLDAAKPASSMPHHPAGTGSAPPDPSQWPPYPDNPAHLHNARQHELERDYPPEADAAARMHLGTGLADHVEWRTPPLTPISPTTRQSTVASHIHMTDAATDMPWMDTERDPLHSRLTKTDDATSPISDIPEQLSPPRTSQQTPEDHSPAASPEGMRSTPTSPTPSEVDMDTSEPDEEPCVQRLVSTTLPPTGRSATDEHNDAVPHLPAAGAQPTITAEEVFQARVQTTVSPSIRPRHPQMDFVRKGTLQSLLEHHPWQVGIVAALGQCCVLALYCAKHGHAWSGRSHHDVRIIEAIKDLKTAIRDVVQAHPAFTGHYMPRWPTSWKTRRYSLKGPSTTTFTSSSHASSPPTRRKASPNETGAATLR
ncbi:hypothetical protein B5M09_008626 [Aphanomyces astaci]|uniref:Uncharacterized protein n=1 Tax=Aphanomyces astaci TaxID=112090 RepID=A0A3R7WIF2_APHAT|nr:hypothetical protein B5M09_008626 [Aphanomyces astaci]